MSAAAAKAINWIEQGYVPDRVIRHGIRRLLCQRLAALRTDDAEAMAATEQSFLAMMDQAQIAPVPHKANEQHYELPPAFFAQVLGRHRKYSSCYWPDKVQTLHEAEAAALHKTCERAALEDGMTVLELGCGWGSLTLWMAQRYPRSRITAVSNSNAQRTFILDQAGQRGLRNVRVITADMNDFNIDERFERVVSVEMFEHMRNYRQLFAHIHDWLRPGGRFFMHIFCHRAVPYEFTDEGPGDWMSRYFFSGGIMPSDGLPLRFQDHLKLVQRWRWHGQHYEKTANAWLTNMDARREALWPILANTYGADAVTTWWMRWRIFFMACAELFGHNDGQEWWVGHYLFERPAS
jgi:cyclopropane-fatty-acyl-phospholipid synthase